MRKTLWATAILLLVAGFAARAADIDFNFEIPTIPYAPKIEEVSNSSAVSGSFTVTASIVGQLQMTGVCDIEPKSDCTASDWRQEPDPDVVPNPPTIQKATVYYYKNDGVTTAASVNMEYNGTLGKYTAEIPLTGAIQGDTITYYIVAIDTRGNVAAQVPDTAQRPCPSTSSWDGSLATPATSSCSYATSYTQCNEYVAGTPGPCATTYTINDKNGDVCGEPGLGSCGNEQCVITGGAADKVDILGISAGADGTYVCTNIGLKAPTPSASDPAPIEGYLNIFFNPDVYDPNPGDTHIVNALAITYAPEAVGSDPTLVKVLWSGDCVTNPNTSNPLDCKLISAVGASEDLKIEYGGGSLKYMVKKSGTGNPLAVPFSILGSTSKMSVIIGLTGEINLSGGTAFWIADLTPGFAFYHVNKTVNVEPPGEPAAPIVLNTRCSVDGTGGTSNKCTKTPPQPAQNKCKITFNKSLDASFTNEYRIYRNTSSSTSGASQIGTVAETGGSTYSYTDTQTTLDGKTYYYFLTSYNSTALKETKMSESSRASCIIEDWVAPEQPDITDAATPAGNEKKCQINWSITTADPSLQSFFISRSDDGGITYDPLNFSNPLGAEPGALTFSWPDPESLDLSTTYAYTVTATDLGSNTNTSLSENCTPEDFKAPSLISSVVATNVNGKIGVKMDWQASEESDLGGYNAWWCRLANKAIDCRTAGSFSKINGALFTSNAYQAANDLYPTIFSEEGDYCFFVEACDNCTTAGTCPSNAGSPNCSGFPSGGADSTLYVKCLNLSLTVDTIQPAFPGGAACTAPATGKKVELSWNHICNNANGTNFDNYEAGPPVSCISPNPDQLVGYKAVFGPAGAVPNYENALAASIAGSVALGTSPELDHNNLVNETEYCYVVYGLDGAGNFSADSVAFPKTEICCTPDDTTAPSKPTMGDIDFTSISCTPAWTKVSDQDSLTYNVYRCQGTSAACATSGAFGTAIATDITEATGLSFADFFEGISDPTDKEFQYCITAKDPSGNQSTVIATSGNTNCGACTPSDRPPIVTGVTAAALTAEENTGVKLFWDENDVDAENTGDGYFVYRCSDATCSSKGSPIESCETTVPTAIAPLIISGEPTGDYYYGVTYRKDCGDALTESSVLNQDAAIDGPITMPARCTKCIVISSCTDYDAGTNCIPVQTVDTSTLGGDGKFAVTGVSGYQVFLADSTNTQIGEAATTDSNGNYKLIVGNDDSSVNTSNKYKIVLVVPEASKGGVPCSPGFSGADCYIVLDAAATVTDDSVIKKISGIKLPEPGGGRAEIGNADCTDSVDVGDLLILKAKFGSNSGDGTYEAYSDFDGNGSIDVEDFLILKKNFGKTLDAAPTSDPTLCKP